MLQVLNRFRSDEALMQAYRRGDTGAFELLYHRHKDGLFSFLYRACPRPAVVEELAQDTWMAVINAAPDYTPEAAFKTWLYRIAHNRQADYWRRRDNQHGNLDEVPEPVARNDGHDDRQARLMRAIGHLPPEQRDALLLQQQGFSLADIAIISGAAEETIKSRLRYGRNQLRQQLGGDR
jgi:RNA polymerase sigma-70 factor (ECF subfamily)